MAADIKRMEAKVRSEFGKGASRRARRDGLIPAVVYSDFVDPIHLDLPGHETFLLVKDSANALVKLQFDGKEQLALVKDVQRHPVRRDILHVDLFAVRQDESVEVTVPLLVQGELKGNLVANQEHFEILVKAPVTHIPESFEVSIDGLEEGDTITISSLQMPAGVSHDIDPEEILVSIVAAEEEPEAAPSEAQEDGEETAEAAPETSE